MQITFESNTQAILEEYSRIFHFTEEQKRIVTSLMRLAWLDGSAQAQRENLERLDIELKTMRDLRKSQ